MTGRMVAAAALVAALASACAGAADTATGPTATDGMRVASANFAENELLAEMYAQVIESIGVPVVRLGPVGPREIIAPSLERALIDIVPEYLGTALSYFGAEEPNPDPESSHHDLIAMLADRGLTALRPALAQDQNVFVVTTATADRHGLEKISDLAGVAAGLRFGGPAECADRPLCLDGLDAVYGLEFAEFVPEESLALRVEAMHRGEIDVGLMFSTASQLDDPTLVVLEDDRALQPAENVVPVARTDALQRWGSEVAEAVDLVSIRLTTTDLRFLNRRVDDGEPIEEVAHDWLSQNGLLGPT